MGLYKSEKGKEKTHNSYDRILELWPVKFEETWVKTRYGKTHLIVCGKKNNRPLFLLPALFADATMWYANIESLSKNYRVFCVDQITYGGKSEPSEIDLTSPTQYKEWFSDIINYFAYDRVPIAGLSYGAWLVLYLAKELPNKVSGAIMLDPCETFIKMNGGIAWRGFWAFTFFPTRKKLKWFFDWIGGGFQDEMSDIWLDHILNVIQYGKPGIFDVPFERKIYTQEDLRKVIMPILSLIGGKPIIYKNPQLLAAAITKALPHSDTKIIKGTGHSLNIEKPTTINELMLNFLDQIPS